MASFPFALPGLEETGGNETPRSEPTARRAAAPSAAVLCLLLAGRSLTARVLLLTGRMPTARVLLLTGHRLLFLETGLQVEIEGDVISTAVVQHLSACRLGRKVQATLLLP